MYLLVVTFRVNWIVICHKWVSVTYINFISWQTRDLLIQFSFHLTSQWAVFFLFCFSSVLFDCVLSATPPTLMLNNVIANRVQLEWTVRVTSIDKHMHSTWADKSFLYRRISTVNWREKGSIRLHNRHSSNISHLLFPPSSVNLAEVLFTVKLAKCCLSIAMEYSVTAQRIWDASYNDHLTHERWLSLVDISTLRFFFQRFLLFIRYFTIHKTH